MMNIDDYEPVESCQISGLKGILAGVFGLTNHGTFVEVGAYDGKSWSNTYQLAKLGWTGLYIEPVVENFARCCGNHNTPNITVLNAFISDKDGEEVEMKLAGGIYTAAPQFLARDPNATYISRMRTSTLDTMLPLYNIEPNFELLVIDVEGNELKVLNGFDIDDWRPKMIIIEAHRYHTDVAFGINAWDIGVYFHKHRYTCIYSDHINDIYVLP